MIPQEISDKLLMLLEKAWVSSELSDKIKEELSKWKEIEVTKVEVKSEWVSPEMVDKMNPEEVKSAFKKHLEMCMKEEEDDDDDSSKWEDKRKMLLWKVNWWY